MDITVHKSYTTLQLFTLGLQLSIIPQMTSLGWGRCENDINIATVLTYVMYSHTEKWLISTFYIYLVPTYNQSGHSLTYGKFSKCSRTFNYLFQAYYSNDVLH